MNPYHQFEQHNFWDPQGTQSAFELPGLRQLLSVDSTAAFMQSQTPAYSLSQTTNGLYPYPVQQHQYVPAHNWPGALQPVPLGALYGSNSSPESHSPSGSTGTRSPVSPLSSASPLTPASVRPSLTPSPSTGAATGQFAVLTLSGKTLASSGNYKDVLSAARSAKRTGNANEGHIDENRVCTFCGKTHMNSHTGQRPHTCYVPSCGRQFTVLSNMYRHAKQCAAQHGHVVDSPTGKGSKSSASSAQ